MRDENKTKAELIAEISELRRHLGLFKSMVEDNDFQALCATVAIDRPDISDVLPHLTMPCLIYVGDADARFEGAKDSASRIPNATFYSLPVLNHLESLTHSALVIPRVKQFLAEGNQH